MCKVHIHVLAANHVTVLYHVFVVLIIKSNLFLNDNRKYDKKELVICSLKGVTTPWYLVQVLYMYMNISS